MTENTHWYWTPGKFYSMQHLHFPDCYYLNIRVGTHFTVVPSRQVVMEKVVWGGLQKCWGVNAQNLHLYTMKSPSVPTQSLSFSFPLILLKWVCDFFFIFFFAFLASIIYPVKWTKDNMKIRCLSLYLRPLSSPMLGPPWLHICTVLTNAVNQIAEL